MKTSTTSDAAAQPAPDDDPRLTAFALGELSGEELAADRAAIEALLARDPAARAAVDQVRELAGELTRELAAEVAADSQAPPLAGALITAPRRTARLRPWLVPALAAAALLLLVYTQRPERVGPATVREVARLEPVSPFEFKSDALNVGTEHELVQQLSQLGYLAEDVSFAETPSPAASKPAAEFEVAGGALAGRGRGAGLLGAAPGAALGPSATSGLGYIGTGEPAGTVGETVLDGGSDHFSPRYFRAWPSTESYEPIVEPGFVSPWQEPLSTFSVDVDTASYSNARRFLNAGQLPPADAVRLEEFINYFDYDYPQPSGAEPFSVTADVASCPWAPQHRLVRIGLQGRELPQGERPASNLVFLVDVSGSMNSPDKLPLVQASLRLLVGKLDERDRIAIVVYAGSAGLVLPSTSCSDKLSILNALDRLQAGGSTAGGAGIQLAYQVAAQHFLKGGTNRVILATDGDFNVGLTARDELQALIERSARTGVFLTVLGFGTGNLKDGTAELLANKGNGHYAYIDSLDEAHKVLVRELGGTLVTIAKDVKLQIEFNPGRVAAYRLLGYENRTLAAQDFNDDRKDAGEIGAGHRVTALYEIVPPGVALNAHVDPLKYQAAPGASAQQGSEAQQAERAAQLIESPELLTVKLRFKEPEGATSKLLERPVTDAGRSLEQADEDLRFAAAAAGFGMLLRGSGHAGEASFGSVFALAEGARGEDADGYRGEFVRLVRIAAALTPAAR
ncbi:MAG: YfbK domain-containing protein [Planctomycetota bacterium]